MRVKNLTVAAALLAAVAVSTGPSASPSGFSDQAANNRCLLHTPTVSADGAKILEHAVCYKGSTAKPAVVSFNFTQLDDQGYSCVQSSGQGSSFALKIRGTYEVRVSFKARAPASIKNVAPASKTYLVNLGSHLTGCNKLAVGQALPPAAQLCGAVIADPLGACGVIVPRPANLPAYPVYPGPYPAWTDKPRMVGQTVMQPHFASPSELCSTSSVVGNTVYNWLGGTVRRVLYRCADRTYMSPSVYLFLTPDAVPGGVQAPPTCGDQDSQFLGGQFSQLNIPASWSGRLDVIYRLYIYDKSGAYVDSEDASNSFFLHGSQDGCQQLTTPG